MTRVVLGSMFRMIPFLKVDVPCWPVRRLKQKVTGVIFFFKNPQKKRKEKKKIQMNTDHIPLQVFPEGLDDLRQLAPLPESDLAAYDWLPEHEASTSRACWALALTSTPEICFSDLVSLTGWIRPARFWRRTSSCGTCTKNTNANYYASSSSGHPIGWSHQRTFGRKLC